MSITALILSLVGIITLFVSYSNPFVFGIWLFWVYVALVCGIVSIVLAALGMKKNDGKKGFAIAGLVVGILVTVWGLIYVVSCYACVGAAASVANAAVETAMSL